MKVLILTIILFAVAGLMFSCDKKESKVAEAPSYGTTMPGDVEKGRALFNDEKLGNGTAGKSCNSCHPAGKGLEAAGEKKEFNIMGKKQKDLVEAVNFCIENALMGRVIFPLGQDMKDIVTYIKSLKK